jgi:hypothetical protein
MPSFGLPSARAEASRRNGAKSRGPKTPEGKARSAQNALKHGFRSQKHVVLPDEDAAAFRELEASLMEELAPEGALQSVLAQRVVAAAWRLSRAERLEAELFAENHLPGRSLGLALIRDGNGSRSFDTLLRYRGGTLAELWRALRTLKALQAEQAVMPRPAVPTPQPRLLAEPHETSIEPESRGNSCESGRPSDRAEPAADPSSAPAGLPPRLLPQPLPTPDGSAPCAQPIEPETRGQRAESAPPSLPAGIVERGGSASLLAGTALVPIGRRR